MFFWCVLGIIFFLLYNFFSYNCSSIINFWTRNNIVKLTVNVILFRLIKNVFRRQINHWQTAFPFQNSVPIEFTLMKSLNIPWFTINNVIRSRILNTHLLSMETWDFSIKALTKSFIPLTWKNQKVPPCNVTRKPFYKEGINFAQINK